MIFSFFLKVSSTHLVSCTTSEWTSGFIPSSSSSSSSSSLFLSLCGDVGDAEEQLPDEEDDDDDSPPWLDSAESEKPESWLLWLRLLWRAGAAAAAATAAARLHGGLAEGAGPAAGEGAEQAGAGAVADEEVAEEEEEDLAFLSDFSESVESFTSKKRKRRQNLSQL